MSGRTEAPPAPARRPRGKTIRIVLWVVVVGVVALVVAGLSYYFSRESGPEPLAGRVFMATSASGDVQLDPDSPVTLRFDDGRIVASAGCNTLAANARWDGGRLEVKGGIATTRRTCTPGQDAQEQQLAAFLQASPAIRTDDEDTLRLSDDTQEVTFEEQAEHSLTGNAWRVTHLTDDGRRTRVAASVRAEVWIGDDEIRIRTGCNTGSGPVTITEASEEYRGTLDVEQLNTTTAACTADETPVQAAMVRTLQGRSDFELWGDELKITQGDDGLVLTAPQE